jgi:hypothetical protein
MVGLLPPNPRDPVPVPVMDVLRTYCKEVLRMEDGQLGKKDLLGLMESHYVSSQLNWKKGLRPEKVEVDNYFTGDEYLEFLEKV